MLLFVGILSLPNVGIRQYKSNWEVVGLGVCWRLFELAEQKSEL
jgi:hypothetical protein